MILSTSTNRKQWKAVESNGKTTAFDCFQPYSTAFMSILSVFRTQVNMKFKRTLTQKLLS